MAVYRKDVYSYLDSVTVGIRMDTLSILLLLGIVPFVNSAFMDINIDFGQLKADCQ